MLCIISIIIIKYLRLQIKGVNGGNFVKKINWR